MPNVTLDFSSVKSNQILEEGVYVLTIKNIKEKVTASGKNMWSVAYEEQETGSTIFCNYVLSPESMWKVKEFCDACGIDTQGIVEVDLEGLKGIQVSAKLVRTEYQGQERNDVAKVFPL